MGLRRVVSADSVIDSFFDSRFANDRRPQRALWPLETVKLLCTSQTANRVLIFIVGTVLRVMTELKRHYCVAL